MGFSFVSVEGRILFELRPDDGQRLGKEWTFTWQSHNHLVSVFSVLLRGNSVPRFGVHLALLKVVYLDAIYISLTFEDDFSFLAFISLNLRRQALQVEFSVRGWVSFIVIANFHKFTAGIKLFENLYLEILMPIILFFLLTIVLLKS